MWSVFIVEDELFAREMIRDFIDWERMGFRLAGEAGNGEEALEQIRERKPDVVICDIVMPVMNGVELLQRVRGLGLDTRFVMLTCVNGFDEVRQALEYGASSYILKLSMSVKSLTDALEKVKRELKRNSAGMNPDVGQWYAEVWRRMGEGGDATNQLPVPSTAAAGDPRLKVAALFAGLEESGRIARMRGWLAASGEPIETHLFAACGLVFLFAWYDRVPRQKMMPVPESGVFHSPLVRPDQWRSAWERVLDEVDEFWYGPESGKTEDASAGRFESERLDWKTERMVIREFEQCRFDACETLLRELWSDMRKHRLPMRSVKAIARSLVATFCKIAAAEPVGDTEIDACSTHVKLERIVCDRMAGCGEKLLRGRTGQIEHPQIRLLVEYVEQHYNRDLTVRSLAKMVAMDETYLSNLFKRQTGQNLIRYIHEVRVKRAKELFASTGWTVSEVGEAVGFADNNYFTRIFRRYAGVTPGEFRRSLDR